MSSLQECAAKLDCSDEAERMYAAEDIGYLNSPEGVPALLRRLGKETSLAVRAAVFQALIRIDADAAIDGSIRLLGAEDPQIRNQAVDVLRHKGDRAVPFLATAMRDGDKDMRKLVLDVLSGTQTSDAEGIYSAALADRDPNVVITAVENLGKIRAEGFRIRIEDLLQTDSHPMLTIACLQALVEIGCASSLLAIRRRFPALATLPDFLVPSCLKAFAALGSGNEFAEVASLLPVRGPDLRPAILTALIELLPRCPSPVPGEDFVPALRAAVENGDPPLCRYQAIRALGLLASRDDVYSFLLSCLSNTERLVRLGAIESLRGAERPGLQDIFARHATTEGDTEVVQALSC